MVLFKGVLDGLHDPPGVDDICSFGFGFLCGSFGENWLDQFG